MHRAVLFVRSLVYLLWLAVTVMPYAVAALLMSVFVRGTPLYWFCVGWVRMAVFGSRAFCGIRARVQGFENLPQGAGGAPVVLASKHQSAWETLAFLPMMPRPLSFVFKRELLWVPFFGWALGRLDMVHINRGRPREAWRKVVEQSRRYTAQGNWVIMFPEGTRTARGTQGIYKSGATKLAVETGAVVVPIAVTSARCWPRNSFLKYPGVIDVSIGRPIASAGRDADELLHEVEAWIEAEMRRLDPEAYLPPAAPSTRLSP